MKRTQWLVLLFLLQLFYFFFDCHGNLDNENHHRPIGKNRNRLRRHQVNERRFRSRKRQIDLHGVKQRVAAAVSTYEQMEVPMKNRALVIYHVGLFSIENSMDVMVNNVKIFASAVYHHSSVLPPLEMNNTLTDNSGSHSSNGIVGQEAVYIFNVIGGADNPLSAYVPPPGANVINVEWGPVNSDMETHLRTIAALGEDLVTMFDSVIFFNQGARGPFYQRHNGEWITTFTKYLQLPNVVLVGPTISCEVAPHVQTHAFAMRAKLVVPTFSAITPTTSSGTSWRKLIEKLEVGLSTHIQSQGYNISSLLYQSRLGKLKHNIGMESSIFNGKCLQGKGYIDHMSANPTCWCGLHPYEVMFMKWGGEPLRTPGYSCSNTIEIVTDITAQLAITIANELNGIKLIIPETVLGGPLYELYKQYTNEMWRDRFAKSIQSDGLIHLIGKGLGLSLNNEINYNNSIIDEIKWMTTSMNMISTSLNNQNALTSYSSGNTIATQSIDLKSFSIASKVCLLVRTAAMHDSKERTKTRLEKMDVHSLIRSLLRQTSPLWKAYFFITDDESFDTRLKEILTIYNDIRLKYVSVDMKYRPAFSREDAGYTTTDYVLERILKNKECKWISVTNADNAYGSEVIQRIINIQTDPFTGYIPDMLLSPLDSRNFAEQDYILRDKMRNEFDRLEERCVGIESKLLLSLYSYTVQPVPIAGKVDLAALFINRERFQKENLHFGNFSDTSKYPCVGCQDGYLTEYLVRNRQWRYYRLPIDGLRSIIFHGPSPALCIASGNVWFDYPHVNKVGCISHELIGELHSINLYDWSRFFHRRSLRICLRLSEKGHAKRKEAMIK